MAVPAGRCAVCPGGAPPKISEMPICPVSAVCKTQAKQRSCIVHDCKRIVKIKQVSGSVVRGAARINLDIFSADLEGQCEYFILDLSDLLHGCPSWVFNTSMSECTWKYVYSTPLKHVEHSMDHIGSHKRAFQFTAHGLCMGPTHGVTQSDHTIGSSDSYVLYFV